jgi:hypothetical protein
MLLHLLRLGVQDVASVELPGAGQKKKSRAVWMLLNLSWPDAKVLSRTATAFSTIEQALATLFKLIS